MMTRRGLVVATDKKTLTVTCDKVVAPESTIKDIGHGRPFW